MVGDDRCGHRLRMLSKETVDTHWLEIVVEEVVDTARGAHVGDMYMSLIHTAELVAPIRSTT